MEKEELNGYITFNSQCCWLASMNIHKDAWASLPVSYMDGVLLVGTNQVMDCRERPLMDVVAREVCFRQGDILETGFGLGVLAGLIAQRNPASYTVIEAHPAIAEKAREWGKAQSFPVTVIEDCWQEVKIAGQFDGIAFDGFTFRDDDGLANFSLAMFSSLKPGGVIAGFSWEESPYSSLLLKVLDVFSDVRFILLPTPSCSTISSPRTAVSVLRMHDELR